MIIPNRLSKGDTIATICLSWGGASALPEAYTLAIMNLESSLGVNIVPTPYALSSSQWLSANPQARAEDLHWALLNPEIKGIISVIGGDDAIRVAKHISIKVIENNPKIFMGFSDTTIIHQLFFTAGVESYYGPSVLTGFAEEGGLFNYTIEAVKQTLFEDSAFMLKASGVPWSCKRHLWENSNLFTAPRERYPSLPWKNIQGNDAVTGRLFGGCLETLIHSLGTHIWPKFDNFGSIVLFLETSEESPPPEFVARFLRSLAFNGFLKNVSAILFGRPGGEQVAISKFQSYDEAITQVLIEENLENICVFTQLDFGHTDPVCVLPYGRRVRINPVDLSIQVYAD
jgi:muramoyltetrapeptide carboxypeptidase LdcA involved in peptidoglycan recycling